MKNFERGMNDENRSNNYKEEKKFKPITIMITLETLEEAEDLWARFCVGSIVVNEELPWRKMADFSTGLNLFNVIDHKLRDQGWAPERGLK